MQCVAANEFDQIVMAVDTNCPYVLVTSADFLASASLTATDIAQSFGWGFGVVVTMWALAYAVKVAIKVINKI